MKTFITNSTDKIPTIFGWPKAIWGINSAKCTQINIKPLKPTEYKNPQDSYLASQLMLSLLLRSVGIVFRF